MTETTQYTKDKEAVELLANTSQLTEAEKAEVEAIYLRAFKEPLRNCNCANKWADAVVKLALWFRNNGQYINCSYSIARGVVFLLDGVAYSAANLTDEAAERLLAENENAAKFIKKIETSEPVAPKKKAATAKKAAPVKTEKEG